MGYVAKHRHAPVSAQKARLVVDLIRGKPVDEALGILRAQPQRAARFFEKVVASAQANAGDRGVNDVDGLVVAKAWVDEGLMFSRARPQARGRMFRIRHRHSHLCVELEVASAS